MANHCLRQSTMKICHLASSSTMEIPLGSREYQEATGIENPGERGICRFWTFVMQATNPLMMPLTAVMTGF